MALSHDLTQLLRDRIYETVDKFAREFEIDPRALEMDIHFILAHLTGRIGILDAGWQEWLDARRTKDQVPSPEAAASQADGSSGRGGRKL